MIFRDEAAKVDSLIKDEKRASSPPADELTSLRVSRIPQIKPARSRGRGKKALLIAKVLQISEQEKSISPPRWDRAALHAHHCCVSQRHPGFVHLENLLIEVHPLQAFVREQVTGESKSQRQFTLFEQTPDTLLPERM
jgi:hypothetical protein